MANLLLNEWSTKYLMVPEGTNLAGLETMWSLTGAVSYEALEAAWLAAGLDRNLLPNPPTPKRALKRALRGEAHVRRLVRPLAEHKGYAIVNEQAIEKVVSHEQQATATLNPAGRPVIESQTFPADGLQATVDHRFDEAMAALSTTDISNWLCHLAEGLHAVPMRPTGGIYFIPHAGVETWLRYRDVVRSVSAHFISLSPQLPIECVFDSIMHAVQEDLGGEADALEKELTKVQTGEKGARAAATQIQKAHEAEAKLAQYEELIERNLDGLRERLDNLRAALVIAALADDSADAVGLDAVAAAGA